MNYRKLLVFSLCAMLTLTGCGSDVPTKETDVQAEETSNTDKETERTTTAVTTEDGHATSCTVDLTEGKYSEEKLDSTWDSSAIEIQLDTLKTSDDSSVSIEGTVITIKTGGTYLISGTLNEGQLIVETPKDSDVKLVLNGVTLNNSSSSALYIKEGKTVVVLAEHTINTFTDGANYTFADSEDEPDAAIFAKDDLSFNGTGTLIVKGNYKDAIKCKDDLKFISGTYEITSADDSIVGKDSVSVKDGTYTIVSEGDAIKATCTSDTSKGYVMIDGGDFEITSAKDGIVAETLLRVNGGNLTLQTGEYSASSATSDGNMEMMNPQSNPSLGSGPETMKKKEAHGKNPFAQDSDSSENTVSTKAFKSYVELVIAGGTIAITSEDDSVHSDQNITIDNGTITLVTGDDGIHAEKKLTINDGTIRINDSYEGLEAFDIIINNGNINLTASDDGINAAGDADSAANPEEDETAETDGTNPKDNFSNFHGAGGMMAAENQGATLTINGGAITLLADGDVIDINGDGTVTGGTVIAQGPTFGGNGTLDYASSFTVEGGTFWGVGSSQMAMNPQSNSQGLICGTVSQSIATGDKVIVTDSEGNVVMEFEVDVPGQWIGICAPEIKKGGDYILKIGTAQYSATAS